jgi:hypothetical protein
MVPRVPEEKLQSAPNASQTKTIGMPNTDAVLSETIPERHRRLTVMQAARPHTTQGRCGQQLRDLLSPLSITET